MRLILIVALSLVLTSLLAQAREIYRWVDDQGRVHYGDTIPPEYAQKGRAELSKSGRVVKEAPGPLKPDALEARVEAEARARVARQKEQERRRRDKALLASFASVEELDLAERRKLAAIDVKAQTLELRRKAVEERFAKQRAQRSSFVTRNRPVPPELDADIRRTQRELADLAEAMAALGREKEEIRRRFDEDRKRYLELKGETPTAAKN